MFSLPGHDIGDVWPFHDEKHNLMHLFFLIAKSGTGKRWSIGHISSGNLRDWEYHGIVLTPGEPGSFDDSHLATGSVLFHDGRYYMAYTGHSREDEPSCGRIGMAVSGNLMNWEKTGNGAVAELDPHFYEDTITGSRPFLHWRDPFLFRHEERFHIALCARSRKGEVKTRGTVAHLTSHDLLSWQAERAFQVALFCEEMECPQIHFRNGVFYLLYSTHRELTISQTPGGLFCQTSRELDGPYSQTTNAVVKGDTREGYFYALQLLRFKATDYLIGTLMTPDDGSFISDPLPVKLTKNGITR